MKKQTITRAAALLLAGMMAFSVAGCGEKEDTLKQEFEAKYTTEKSFIFTAYSALYDGVYDKDNGVYDVGEDFRSVERYKEYLDSGLNMLLVNGKNAYNGEPWEDSDSNIAFTNAYAAGITKLLLKDNRIDSLIEDKDTANIPEDELVETIKGYLSVYIDKDGFYGVSLRDEPNVSYTPSYTAVYKAVKKAAKKLKGDDYDIYIHVNLLPAGQQTKVCTGSARIAEPDTYETFGEAYYNYLSGFVKGGGMNRVSVDTYAFRGTGFASGFFPSLQIMRKVCDENNARMEYCLQSFMMYSGQTLVYRNVSKSEMMYELNTLIGMGADTFGYYTYQPPTNGGWSATGINFIEDYCFLTRDGKKTNVYYYAQELMSQVQSFANVVLSYDHTGSRLFVKDMPTFTTAYHTTSLVDEATNTAMQVDDSYEFKLLKGFTFDNDVAFVTELYDDDNDLYMYMLQNAIDPINAEDGSIDMTVTADFGKEYKYVAQFDCGELSIVKLDDGKYQKNLSAGYAVYLVPLK